MKDTINSLKELVEALEGECHSENINIEEINRLCRCISELSDFFVFLHKKELTGNIDYS